MTNSPGQNTSHASSKVISRNTGVMSLRHFLPTNILFLLTHSFFPILITKILFGHVLLPLNFTPCPGKSLLGFGAGDPGSKPNGDTFELLFNDYAIRIYLSSVKLNSEHQQDWWRKPLVHWSVQLRAVPGWYVRVRISLLTHRDMTAAAMTWGVIPG